MVDVDGAGTAEEEDNDPIFEVVQDKKKKEKW